MKKDGLSRWKFIKETIGASLLVSGAGLLPSCSIFQKKSGNVHDAKGLPTVPFGSTGIRVPRIVCGLGSRFCHIDRMEVVNSNLKIFMQLQTNG